MPTHPRRIVIRMPDHIVIHIHIHTPGFMGAFTGIRAGVIMAGAMDIAVTAIAEVMGTGAETGTAVGIPAVMGIGADTREAVVLVAATVEAAASAAVVGFPAADIVFRVGDAAAAVTVK